MTAREPEKGQEPEDPPVDSGGKPIADIPWKFFRERQSREHA